MTLCILYIVSVTKVNNRPVYFKRCSDVEGTRMYGEVICEYVQCYVRTVVSYAAVVLYLQ